MESAIGFVLSVQKFNVNFVHLHVHVVQLTVLHVHVVQSTVLHVHVVQLTVLHVHVVQLTVLHVHVVQIDCATCACGPNRQCYMCMWSNRLCSIWPDCQREAV